jgi:RNA polymerase sigma-70 factor, ECF subfamily
MTRADEQQLIDRLRQGDDEAFRALVDQYKRLVFGLIARSVADQARAEELAQDVFLRVYRGLPYFRAEARLSTWIFRIVTNLLAEERRTRGIPAISLDDTRDDRPPIQPASLDTAFSSLELRDRLAKALFRLPPNYQLLVNGHYFEGLSYEELAESFGMPMGTVKTYLHRAKRLLRQALETELQ